MGPNRRLGAGSRRGMFCILLDRRLAGPRNRWQQQLVADSRACPTRGSQAERNWRAPTNRFVVVRVNLLWGPSSGEQQVGVSEGAREWKAPEMASICWRNVLIRWKCSPEELAISCLEQLINRIRIIRTADLFIVLLGRSRSLWRRMGRLKETRFGAARRQVGSSLAVGRFAGRTWG